MKSWMRITGAISAGMLLAGCVAMPADRGESVTTELLEPRSSLAASIPIAGAGDTQSVVASLIAMPVDAEAAVRLALLQSPRMRMLYTELGFAQAEVYDASRLSNPSLGYFRLAAEGGAATTTWSLSQSFTELLFLGYRTRVSRSQLLQTQQRVAAEVLTLEADVRSAYYQYVSAELVAQMRLRATALSTASSQYAQQLFDAGNISALQLSREQAQASEAAIQQRMASSQARAAQGQLMNLLGLPMTQVTADSGSVSFLMNLPLPVVLTAELPVLQQWALAQRLDLAALREQVNLSSTSLKTVRRWRWLGAIQLQAERERDSSGETATGFGAELELPLFNQGGGNLLRAQAGLEWSQAGVAAMELAIGNDMAVRHAAVQAAYANVDEYRQRLVPLRERIVELSQQQQTFMLIGAFELLSAKQQEMDSYQAYLEAVRDYWIAYTELLRTAGGQLPAGVDAGDTGISIGLDASVDDTAARNDTTQSTPGNDHSGHEMPGMQPTSGETP